MAKFKTGDRVKVVNADRWTNGCVGTITGVVPTAKSRPYYILKLDESPNAYFNTTYVHEDDLEKEKK